MSHRSNKWTSPHMSYPPEQGAEPRTGRLRPIAWLLVGLLMLLWSLLAGLLYVFTDPVLAWLASALDLVVDQGRGAANTIGNKQAGEILTALDTSTLPGQLLSALRGGGKVLIVIVWLVGMAVLAVLPFGLSYVGRHYYRGRR